MSNLQAKAAIKIEGLNDKAEGLIYKGSSSYVREERILVLKTGMAGIHFNIKSKEESKALDAITPGTELMLIREPDNKYDEFAIAVYLTKEDKLGYITRYKNEPIARLMDEGKRFIAIVDEGGNSSENAPTEDMGLPFSVYMVEEV